MKHYLAAFTNFANSLSPHKFGLALIIAYVTFLNVFVIKTTPELIFLQLIPLAFFYARPTKFITDWVPYIALFMLYEYLRGFADTINPFAPRLLNVIYRLETAIFTEIPTVTLQRMFDQNYPLIYISVFFYSTFFYFSFFTGFLIWAYRREYFHKYFNRFIAMSFVGLIFFALLPTAPPWYVNEITDLGIHRIIYDGTFVSHFASLTVFGYFVGGNAVAALPSLHTAWTVFTALFLIRHFGKKFYPFLIIPLMIGFAVVFTAEHYVIDVLAGFLLAWVFVYVKDSKPCLSTAR